MEDVIGLYKYQKNGANPKRKAPPNTSPGQFLFYRCVRTVTRLHLANEDRISISQLYYMRKNRKSQYFYINLTYFYCWHRQKSMIKYERKRKWNPRRLHRIYTKRNENFISKKRAVCCRDGSFPFLPVVKMNSQCNNSNRRTHNCAYSNESRKRH